jgi:predicted glycosyltransferase
LARRIADKLAYTGYLVELPEIRRGADGPGAGEVLVSAGGGAVGERLLETAMAARPLTRLATAPWRLLVGPNLASALPRLRAAAPAGVIVEPAREDFVERLAHCRLSISQAGYNTLIELVAVGARAVVVPFAAAAETEQTLRAELMAEKGLVELVHERELGADSLARAAERALARADAGRPAIDLSGLATSVRLIGEALAGAAPGRRDG